MRLGATFFTVAPFTRWLMYNFSQLLNDLVKVYLLRQGLELVIPGLLEKRPNQKSQPGL